MDETAPGSAVPSPLDARPGKKLPPGSQWPEVETREPKRTERAIGFLPCRALLVASVPTRRLLAVLILGADIEDWAIVSLLEPDSLEKSEAGLPDDEKTLAHLRWYWEAMDPDRMVRETYPPAWSLVDMTVHDVVLDVHLRGAFIQPARDPNSIASALVRFADVACSLGPNRYLQHRDETPNEYDEHRAPHGPGDHRRDDVVGLTDSRATPDHVPRNARSGELRTTRGQESADPSHCAHAAYGLVDSRCRSLQRQGEAGRRRARLLADIVEEMVDAIEAVPTKGERLASLLDSVKTLGEDELARALAAHFISCGIPAGRHHARSRPSGLERRGWTFSQGTAPDWGSEEIVVGRRVNGIYARLSVREHRDGGFLGTVTCGYPWWTAPTVASSAEVAATAAAEEFDERFGHAVGTQEARAAERYIEGRSHGLLIRRGDGTHVLNNEHFGGMLSLLSHDGLGTHAWADAVDLSDFPALRDLHQGVGPIRLGDPLFQMLDSVHRGAWEFGYAEAADYIHDMHAIAALDYPTLVMPPPIVGWPTVREALISLIWPVSGLPLESYGREYYDALRRWLDGAATQLAPAYTGPGAEELGMALTVFDKRHGYIEDTRWEPRSMGGVGGSPATD